MNYRGTVKNGQIQLPPEAVLPEGAAVLVDVEVREEDFPDWSRGLIGLIKNRDWPEDMSLNHAHYLHGMPKK